jgi:hypothetical protein
MVRGTSISGLARTAYFVPEALSHFLITAYRPHRGRRTRNSINHLIINMLEMFSRRERRLWRFALG